MPRLMGGDDGMQQHKLAGNFTFSGKRLTALGASEYTLATIAVDETGSTVGFKDELRKMLETAVNACKKSPRSDNLLLRVVYFSSSYPNGVKEVHGFKPLAEIDVSKYPDLDPGGWTPLCDAVYSAVGAMNKYGEELAEQDFDANGIGFVITDGGENSSVATMNMVKEELSTSVTGEKLESMVTVLIGINTTVDSVKRALAKFQKDAGMTQYIDAGEATPGKLAKLAQFIDQSISSQSQALGTGGPSQNIAVTI